MTGSSIAPSDQRPATLRVLLGIHGEDMESEYRHTPVVIGAMDMTTWEILPPEETDALFAEMKRKFSPDWGQYEWREVEIDVSAESLRAAFDASRMSALDARAPEVNE